MRTPLSRTLGVGAAAQPSAAGFGDYKGGRQSQPGMPGSPYHQQNLLLEGEASTQRTAWSSYPSFSRLENWWEH